MRNFLAFLLLVLIGILGRTVWHVGPNIELVTVGAILAGLYFGRIYAVLTPLLVMVVSDRIIGNTNIYYFTWSAYILMGLGAYFVRKKYRGLKIKGKVLAGAGGAVLASLFFYIWTNFGVWAMDSWGIYSRDFGGLFKCFVMGIPFLRNNLAGNFVFVPMFILGTEMLKMLAARLDFFSRTARVK